MKNYSRPQYYRIKRILEIIREGTRTGRYPNSRDFMGELQISWRSAMRDLDFLRDEEGAPVEYDSSKKGYFLSDKTWQLPPVELSKKEIFAFSIARKLMEGFRGTPLEMDMQSVLRKVGEAMEGKITLDPGALTEHLTVIGEDYVKQDAAIWSAVARAVDRREEIRIVYEKFNGEVKTQVLRPYHMIAYHGNWYVLAGEAGGREKSEVRGQKSEGREEFEQPPSQMRYGAPGKIAKGPAGSGTSAKEKGQRAKRGENVQRPTPNFQLPSWEQIKTFAMSRIRKIEETGKAFEVPAGFDAKAHMRRAFGIVAGDKLFRVKLRFSLTVSAYIRERIWHPAQVVKERRDGGIDLEFETGGWKELVRWILSWQPDVKVLAPRRLRERVKEKMREGLRIVKK